MSSIAYQLEPLPPVGSLVHHLLHDPIFDLSQVDVSRQTIPSPASSLSIRLLDRRSHPHSHLGIFFCWDSKAYGGEKLSGREREGGVDQWAWIFLGMDHCPPHNCLSMLIKVLILMLYQSDRWYVRGNDLGARFEDLVSVRLLLDASVLRDEDE